MKVGILFVACAALLAACGDDSEGDGGNEQNALCYMVCDAQHEAEVAGDCVALSVEDCRALCGAGASCQAEFDAMHECWLTGEFMCAFFSAESDAECQAQEDAYFDCIQ